MADYDWIDSFTNQTSVDDYKIVIDYSFNDTTPPATISNLVASNPTDDSITLTWTSPGDDGSTGQATYYDIRWSYSPINSSNWYSAIEINGEPLPLYAGNVQSYTVTPLLSGRQYYFAMKSADGVPNWSGVSNCTNSTTIGPPSVTTNAATGIGTTGATLNGNLTSLGSDSSVQVSFEYGLTTSYGNTTTPLNRSSTGTYNTPISGLSPGTTYHFRAKAVGDGTDYGDDREFTTTSGGTLTLYEHYYASAARSGGVNYLTQTFTPQTSHTVRNFKLLISNDDTTGTLVGSIRATDANGAPTGPNLATSQTINETTLPYDWTEVTFDLGSGCQLQAGTTYAIQIQTSQIGISVRVDSGNPYDDGQYGKSNDGTNWNMSGWADYDIWFEEYGNP